LRRLGLHYLAVLVIFTEIMGRFGAILCWDDGWPIAQSKLDRARRLLRGAAKFA